MSRWFRWYEGTSEDGKFRLVARNADVTVATVMGVWAVLLEDASHAEHRGIAERGEDFYAAILELPAEQLQTILVSMENAGLISVGHGAITITKWKERQFETDTTDGTNAERQRRFRQKHKTDAQKHKSNANVTDRNGTVTEAKRPDTDTDTDTDTEKERGSADAPDDKVVPLHPFVFEGGIVRLNQTAFDRWRQAFHAIPDLVAVLTAADDYYTAHPPDDGKWFFPVSRWLQKEHERALKERRRRVPDV